MRLKNVLIGVALGLTGMLGRDAVSAEIPPGAYGNAGKISVLSEEPRIFLIENFLTYEECDHLIEKARPALKRSTVLSDHLENGDVNRLHAARTSKGMFFEKPSTDPVLRRVEKRIAALTGLPEANGEAMQILSYGLNAEYRPHYDYFDPSTPGGAVCYNRGGQRLATLVMYLADTEEGGETIFPYADVFAKPIKGNAVLLYNCTPDGAEDPLSLHGSAPVIRGEKWVAVKWLRQNKFY
jgi:prolyl 4-hydroxylase